MEAARQGDRHGDTALVVNAIALPSSLLLLLLLPPPQSPPPPPPPLLLLLPLPLPLPPLLLLLLLCCCCGSCLCVTALVRFGRLARRTSARWRSCCATSWSSPT